MNKMLLVLFVLLIAESANAQNGIFISEYFEGASNNKAIEIYNGINTGATINLNKLKVNVYANGSATITSSLTLGLAEDGVTSTLAYNSTFVIYNSLFAAVINTNLPNAPTSRRVSGTNATNYNGDDAIELQYDNGSGFVTVDVFGQIGFDPGTFWGTGNTTTLDNGIIRKSSLNTGRTNAAFTPSDFFDGRSVSADGNIPVTTVGQHTCTSPLPVELTSFTAINKGHGVELSWKTATEVNNAGFEIEKAVVSNQQSATAWSKIGFVEGNGTTNAPKSYSFTDRSANGKTSYRLKQIDRDGKFEYSQTVEVTAATAPKEFALEQNYPNPFNPTTVIGYQLSASGVTTLKIYDAIGSEVASLVNEVKDAGTYSAQFDGTRLSSGMYFARLTSNGRTQIRKLQLMK